MRFSYTICHVLGKLLYVADAPSRCPMRRPHTLDIITQQETVESHITAVVMPLPASEERLKVYHSAQMQDRLCSKVIDFTQSGWPNKQPVQPDLKPFWEAPGLLTVFNGLLLYGNRIVTPKKLQMETLSKLHHGHQGIQRCRLRAATSVWWPGISNDVEKFVRQCPQSCKSLVPAREPLT